jgi:hypothetical protein
MVARLEHWWMALFQRAVENRTVLLSKRIALLAWRYQCQSDHPRLDRTAGVRIEYLNASDLRADSRHAFPPSFDPFFSQIQKCYDSVGHGGISWPPPAPDEVPDAC